MVLLWKTHRFKAICGVMLFAGAAFNASAQSAPDTFSPDSLPAAWSYESPLFTSLPSDDRWWTGFDDPILSSLIARGENNSLDLSATLHRIEAARRNWQLAYSAYFPTIGLSAGWTKNRSAGDLSIPAGRSMTTDYFSLGLSFSWEIDVFGRVREQAKLGKADFNATRAEYEAAMVSLAANIAKAYINLRLAQECIEVARRQIASQEKIKAITEARFETGLASKLDVAQSLTVLYSTQASLPALENEARSAINSLALLIGVTPAEIEPELKTPGSLPNPFRTVNIGVPADLLRRRPDIRRAEYELAGFAAQAGIAKKDFLPTLSLQGSIGTSAHNAKDLFTKESFTYSIAPSLSWTVFEGMARNRRAAMAKENMLAGIDSYNLAVLTAVTETETALSGYEANLRRIALVQKVCRESEESFTLAVDRYKRGLSAFTDVMNAQISMLDNETSLLQTRAAALNSLISVYAAVAGSPESR